MEELQAIKDKVDLDIARQRSKDTGGDDGKKNRFRVLGISMLLNRSEGIEF